VGAMLKSVINNCDAVATEVMAAEKNVQDAVVVVELIKVLMMLLGDRYRPFDSENWRVAVDTLNAIEGRVAPAARHHVTQALRLLYAGRYGASE
jgi:hypothetical protein